MDIPIVILTSSINEEDRTKAYFLPDVKGFLNKPATFESMTVELRKLVVAYCCTPDLK